MSSKFTSDKVKKIGRTVEINSILWCGLSGSGIGFSFVGTRASITLVGDDTTYGTQTEGQARVAVYVNDVRVKDIMIDQPEIKVDICQASLPSEFQVRVIKLSECPMSTFGIKRVETDAVDGIHPLPEKKLKIEFIGDSITCGFGVDTDSVEIPFQTNTEDVTRAYAYKVAEALDADYSMCAFSGYGIISGYTDTGIPSTEQLVPLFYEKIGFSYAKPFGTVKLSKLLWNFTEFCPDLVVINLGTNDDSYCQNQKERQDEFSSRYADFLEVVHFHNPNARILCTVGTMCERIKQPVEKAVRIYQDKTGDKSISYLGLPLQLPEDGLVSCWHPTEATHNKAAALLVDEIKRILRI